MRLRSTLSILLLAAIGQAASITAGSREPKTLRFVYSFSEQPAAHLAVSLTDPHTAESTRLFLGPEGILALPEGDRRLEILDPRSGLTLFARISLDHWDKPEDGVVRLPLPVRVVGTLEGFGNELTKIEIHHGSGLRVPVGKLRSSAQRSRASAAESKDQAWGLKLPSISSHWQMVRPRQDSSFDTGWIAVTAPPQLAISDRTSRMATLEVPLPVDISAHAVISAGIISPQASGTIEIDRSALPAADLPLILQASLEKASVQTGTEESAALRLALLEILDPRIAHFARRGSLPLRLEGVTRIAGLPWFNRADLIVTGPLPGISARHSVVSEEGTVARIALAKSLVAPTKRVTLGGLVQLVDGAPVVDATVVVSSYPDRFETRTDVAGHFAAPTVPTGREVVVFVDAPMAGDPPFDRFTTTRRIEVPADSGNIDLTIEVTPPHSLAKGALVSCPNGEPKDATLPIAYRFEGCGSQYTQSLQMEFCPILEAYQHQGDLRVVTPLEVSEIWVNPIGGEAEAILRVPRTGRYEFVLSYTPFVYAEAVAVVGDISKPLSIHFQPPQPEKSAVISVISGAPPAPAADIEVMFPNRLLAAEPYDDVTDALGTVKIDCFTRDPVAIFIASDAGCSEGELDLASAPTIVLGSCKDF